MTSHFKPLLHFPLYVDVRVGPENVGEPGPSHLGLNHFCGQRDARQQPRDFPGNSGKMLLLLQNVLLNRNDRPFGVRLPK